MQQMRIVMITGDGLAHRYVANRLCQEVQLAGIVVDHGKPTGSGERIRKLWRRYTLGQFVSRFFLVLLRKFWKDDATSQQSFLSVFGAEKCSEFHHRGLVTEVHGINTPAGVKVITDLQPDVILVYGTGIVGGKVLSLARKIALNMHTGLSPYYRGADCAFWPLYNRELHMLGATVHECTKEVDGGKIFGTTHARLAADDGLFCVLGRCVTAGAELYAQKVRELVEHGLSGTAQDFSIGTEYKAYMRGVGAEWKVRRSIHTGLIRDFVESEHGSEIPASPLLQIK